MLFQRSLNLVVLLSFLASGYTLHAEEKKAPRKALEIGKVLHITYGSPSWNTDSAKIDTAMIVLRDKTSGKIVQIQLEETEPDSSQFTGRFSLNIGDQASIVPEIYVPPQDLRGGDKDNAKLFGMIQAGQLQRKPVIWKKNDKGQPLLEVYDTREQAEAGLKAYDEEQKATQELRRKKPITPTTNEDAVAMAAAAERKAQLDKLALDAAKHMQDRVRMEQIEKQKADERMEASRRMSEAERAERREKAVAINAEALVFYNKGDFVKAEGKFKQAVELDPENKDYNYKYGITLYRNQKYNDALVSLKLAKVSPQLETEKKYYMGLVLYRLSELDNSLRQFDEVAKSKDPELGPSSTFYVGVIQFAQEKYDPAKKSFESVLDNSKDPRLDEQAESYIDRIAAAMAFQKMRENKFTLMAVVGAMYDSNVLLSPDNIPGGGKPTSSSDMRLLTLADLQYRPVFNEHHEWAPHATINLTNSAKNASAPADPFIYDVAAPYSYKGTAFGKGYKFTATPGYELLYMDPTNTGTKSEEMASYFVNLDNTFVVSKDWVSTYTLGYRNDKSMDPLSVGPDDLSSNQYSLRTVQTVFLDSGRKQSIMPGFGITRNNAKGSNKTYNRYDLGATYARPMAWGCGWNIGLNYYQMTYQNLIPDKRTDNDYTLTTGISKPIKDWVIWGLTGAYTKNASTDTSFAYTKYTILTTATFVTNF